VIPNVKKVTLVPSDTARLHVVGPHHYKVRMGIFNLVGVKGAMGHSVVTSHFIQPLTACQCNGRFKHVYSLPDLDSGSCLCSVYMYIYIRFYLFFLLPRHSITAFAASRIA